MNESILFHHSRVRELEAFKAVESDDTMPLHIYPAFIGSRILSFGLDATGMQGLDARQAEYPLFQSQYGDSNNYDDLYVFHTAVKSNHAIHRKNDYVRMPLGWIDYSLTMDGKEYSPEQIAQEAKNWRRTFDLAKVLCTTEYDLNGVWVSIESYCTRETIMPRFNFALVALDGKSHEVEIESRIHFTLRDGTPIFEALPKAWKQGSITGFSLTASNCEKFQVMEDYPLTYAIKGGNPFQSNNLLGVKKKLSVKKEGTSTAAFAFYFGSHQSNSHNDEKAVNLLTSLDPVSKHENLMKDYWMTRAAISTGDIRRDWLYHYNIYLADFGTTMEFGAQCSGNFVPFHLGDRVFWDSHHIIDGILHVGAIDHARKKIDWLEKALVANKGRRPFYWMVHYNGKTESSDTGFMSICAHAMSAQRIAQFAQDTALTKRCFAIVDACVKFAITEKFFEKTPEGWILSTVSATDVTFSDEFMEKAKNNTYTFCWFLSVLAKGHEMASTAGKHNAAHWKLAKEITENYYLEQNENEYLDQRDGKTGERHDSYLPVLCYPTEGQHWVEKHKYQFTRMLHDHYCSNMAFVGFKMPWPMQWGAASDFRAGIPDAGEARLRNSFDYYVGLGLPCEGESETLTGTTQPYLSASGTLLTAQSEQFFYTDFFTGDIKLFTSFGRNQEIKSSSFERIYGSGGLVASGCYSPTEIEVSIHSKSNKVVNAEILVPYLIRHQNVELMVNGKAVAHEALKEKFFPFIDSEDKWRTFTFAGKTISIPALALKKGLNKITLKAAPAKIFNPSKTLVYDFNFFGKSLGKLLGGEDKVHLVNIRRDFVEILPQADFAISTDPTWNPQGREYEVLEQFVQGGGKLVLFYETAHKSNTLSKLLGLSLDHTCGHRWTQEPLKTKIQKTKYAGKALPSSVEFLDEVRLKGEVAEDVEILYTTTDDAVYCTKRKVGDGEVLWIASGQSYLTHRDFLKSKAWQEWFIQIYHSLIKV
ncbi:MAG: hypothetical protein SGI98_00620 [Verrucomicrobiota bacterium]|nr:hypothetical protein [Verrucomicrobiota bacterium]